MAKLKKLIFVIILTIMGACVSQQASQEAFYRYEYLIRNQCDQVLNFPIGTQGFIDCRRFYNDWFQSLEIDTNSLSISKVKHLEDKVDSLNQICYIYWGGAQLKPDILWECVQQRAQEEVMVLKHQRQLDEQEDILLRKISLGNYQENERVLWQERVEAERQKVARERGKEIRQVKCRTTKQINGNLKVKCR